MMRMVSPHDIFSYNYLDNITRIRLEVYGSFFGVADPLKKVHVFHVEAVNTPVSTTLISWTPTLITLDLDVVHGEYYDVSVEVKGKPSEMLRFRP